MHREFDSAESPFRVRSNTPLYLFTAILAGLLIADLWPLLAGWLTSITEAEIPTWTSRTLFGYRFALIAAVIGGARVLYGSLESLTEGKIGADLAIAIACVASILIGEPLVAAEVVFIGLVGECLEAYTFDRTQRALRGLAELFPTRCWVLRDGQEVRIFTTELALGDRVVVKPGGKIPADGTITDGRSSLDTSPLTGESVPRDVGPGDAVLAGCVNQHGAITISADRLAKQTVAGQVIELTAAALRDKGSQERLADRLARYFLPVVLGITALTFFFNVWLQSGPVSPDSPSIGFKAAARLAIYPTLAVLVTACPCPLVLATPAAVIAALGRLAGTGVLVKGGAALERLASVRAIAFDKTGTLTEGRPELGSVYSVEGTSNEDVLRWAAIAEQRSEHVYATAIVATARTQNATLEEVTEFQAFPGAGVRATTHTGQTVLAGSPRLMTEQGITVSPDVNAKIAEMSQHGESPILVARDGQLLGVIGLRDALRPESAGVISELRDMGISPILLLTGDRRLVADAITKRLPHIETHADLLPHQKAEIVKGIATPGGVCFIGDGINDAPALAQASVGIAIGSGTDVAIQTGDVVMMGEPLRSLPMLVRLSRKMVDVIRQNIIWFGFGVNILGVILTGWIWPLISSDAAWYEKAPLAGVIYHQLGSILVLLNSMRLLAFERAGTSLSFIRINQTVQNVDVWLSRWNVDELFHALGHRKKWILSGAAAIALGVYIASGVTQIDLAEAGVVTRWGKVQSILAPGLHLRWPWPVETITKMKPNEVRVVEMGYRTLSKERQTLLRDAIGIQSRITRSSSGSTPASDQNQTWVGTHTDETARISDEAMYITADGNLVELLATVQYRIADPVAYLSASVNIDSTLRAMTSAALNEQLSRTTFITILTTGRMKLEDRVNANVKSQLRLLDPSGMGIVIDGITIHDLHPPQEVVKAYHAVAIAIQERDRAINVAKADSIVRQRRAEQESRRTVLSAEADSNTRISEAMAQRDVFSDWVNVFTRLSQQEMAGLEQEHKQMLQSGVPLATANSRMEERRNQILTLRRELTEFRLGVESAVAMFQSRSKIIIDDSHGIPVRYQMMILNSVGSTFPPFLLPQSGAGAVNPGSP